MRFVSPFLKKVVYPSMSGAGVFRRTASSGVAVLTYHGVLPPGYTPIDSALDGNLVSCETLRRQIQFLKKRYNLISPESFLAWRRDQEQLPPRAVLLTCDDGLLNCFSDMLPVLQEETVRGLFFVTGASTNQSRATLWYEDLLRLFLGAAAGRFCIACGEIVLEGELASTEERRRLWWHWVRQLSQVSPSVRHAVLAAAKKKFSASQCIDMEIEKADFASWRRFSLMGSEELVRLADAGMTLGAHTLSHPLLAHAPVEMARAEIFESKAMLEAVLGRKIWALAYPFGFQESITTEVLKLAQEAGFDCAFLNYGGGLGVDLSRFALPRIHVTAEMTLSELDAHVSGFYVRLHGGLDRGHRTELARA
jgi:peptidoglycan/xylan/chitin deacetylase (PgdA/CDA1 family)